MPATIPLASGLMVLGDARGYVSGRYHPSVLASLVGIPLVLMASNSHKTESLQRVLGIAEPQVFPFLTQTPDIEPMLSALRDAVHTDDTARERRRAVAASLAARATYASVA